MFNHLAQFNLQSNKDGMAIDTLEMTRTMASMIQPSVSAGLPS